MQPESAAVGLIIVAAGSGRRLGADVPKAFVPLAGVPILGHAVRGALSCADVREVVVVAPEGWLDDADTVCRWARSQPDPRSQPPSAQPTSSQPPSAPSKEQLSGDLASPSKERPLGARVTVVAGGAERGDSVAAGLAVMSAEVGIVLVHDAARCLTPPEVFERVIGAIRAGAVAVVPGVAVVDTVKQVDESGRVVGTPDRSLLRAVQTPQGFRRDVLERAHEVSSDATDDAGLVERLGEPVIVVEGDALALKITTGDDLARAARLLSD